MDIKIFPQPLGGKITAITSKSDAHRCLICAALCSGKTEIVINDPNRDIEATVRCIESLGAKVSCDDGRVYKVIGMTEIPEKAVLSCGESGSTLRFLLPIAAALNKSITFTGEGRLPKRPLSPLMEQLQLHGCIFSQNELPLTVSGGLNAGRYELPGNVSSQYITGLLMALPMLRQDSEIILTSPLESAGYVDMTLRTISIFGVNIEVIPGGKGYKITGGQKFVSPVSITAEGDWSNAAFWLAAGAVSGKTEVGGLDLLSPQGDKAIVKLLGSFGACCESVGGSITVSKSPMHGIMIDAGPIPDLVPILTVAACAAKGETVIKNAARLRIKESDRLNSVTAMITALDGDITELEDGLIIKGTGKLKGGTVDSFNDHRIVMAAAVASSICEQEVVITGAQAVEKSYPKFFEHFNMLGGNANVI